MKPDSAVYRGYRDWKSWSANEFGVCDLPTARYFQAELAKSGILLKPGVRVLEVGFGNGQFAAWATATGASYTGTELDETLVQLARSRGFDAHCATLSLDEIARSGKYGFIFAFDVFEHLSIEEITTLLGAASECLLDDGLLLARFPSGDSPFSRSIQHGDLTHRSVIGSGIVRQLAAVTGFDVDQVRAPAFPMTGLGLRTFCRRAVVALARSVISRIVNLAFHDNQSRVLSPNMLVVLRKAAGKERERVS